MPNGTEDRVEVRGRCLTMCPTAERQLRERSGLLHKFEWADSDRVNDTSVIGLTSGGDLSRSRARQNRFKIDGSLKADVERTVKEFGRSAAGVNKMRPDDLRPPPVLRRTVLYLCTKVLTKTGDPFPTVFDFVFDRLRAVRQDLVVQRVSDLSAIQIMESIVRFHVYSAYRCRTEPVMVFDPHINRKHLVDCLKRLLWLYAVNDYWKRSRLEFETLFLLVAPEAGDMTTRTLSLTQEQQDLLMKHEPYKHAFEMCLAYQCRNYVKYFGLVKHIPPLLASYVVQHAVFVRRKAFEAISKAYGIKTCKYPLLNLQSILLYPHANQLELDLQKLSVQVKCDAGSKVKYAVFNKDAGSFDMAALSCDISILDPEGVPVDPASLDFISKELICPWYYKVHANPT